MTSGSLREDSLVPLLTALDSMRSRVKDMSHYKKVGEQVKFFKEEHYKKNCELEKEKGVLSSLDSAIRSKEDELREG